MKGRIKTNRRGETYLYALIAIVIFLVLGSFLIYPLIAGGGPAPRTRHLSNIKQIGLATLLYLNDYDDVYPPAQSQTTFRSLVNPHIKRPKVWTEGATEHGIDIRFNTNLANVRFTDIPNPDKTLAIHTPFHQKIGDPVEGYLVGFADGSAKFIAPTDWTTVKNSGDLLFPRVSQDFYPPETVIP